MAKAVQAVRGLSALLPDGLSDRDRDLIGRAVGMVTELETSEQDFAEFAILRRYYAGELRLPDATAVELKRAAGEFGTSAAARLGLSAATDPADIKRAALDALGRWNGPQAEEENGRVLSAVLKRRYEEVYDRAQQAQQVLAHGRTHEEDAFLPERPRDDISCAICERHLKAGTSPNFSLAEPKGGGQLEGEAPPTQQNWGTDKRG